MKYEVTDFVKKLSADSLGLILAAYPLELAEDWIKASARKRLMTVFTTAFERLSEKTQEALGAVLREIEIVGGSNRFATMIMSTLDERGVELSDEDRAQLDKMPVADRACWCKFKLSSADWEILLTRASQAQRPAKEWKSYALTFVTDPAFGVFKSKKEVLEQAVSGTVVATEYRGHHCESDAYQVDNCEYILFDLSDNPSTRKAMNDEGTAFETLTKRMAFQIVCRFDHTNHRLAILHQDEIASTYELSRAIVDAAFSGEVEEMSQVCYNLTYFRNQSTISPDPKFGFESVKILRLDLWLGGNKNSRRSYYELNADIQEAIGRELSADDLANAFVNCVQLRFTPNTINGNERPRSLEVSTNSVRNITQYPIEFQRRVTTFLESLEGVVLPKAEV